MSEDKYVESGPHVITTRPWKRNKALKSVELNGKHLRWFESQLTAQAFINKLTAALRCNHSDVTVVVEEAGK